jgi:predicted MFS family arabinose efflux permease
MGRSGALIALAALLAPASSGLLRDRWGYDAVFLAVSGLLLATALGAYFLVSEPYRRTEAGGAAGGGLAALLTRAGLRASYLAGTALSFGLGTLVTQLPLYLADAGYGSAQTGLAFSAFALAAMVVMAGPVVRGRPGGNWLGLAEWGLAVVGVALLLLPLLPGLWGVGLAMACYGLDFGLIFPAANAQVAGSSAAGERGRAFGLFYAFYSVGVILGAGAAGLLADAAGHGSAFYVGATVSLASAALLVLLRRRARASLAREDYPS